jgi:hypothetical protein
MHVSLVLDVVVALPPSWILAMQPCIPRLESKVMPSYENFFGRNLGMGGNTRSVIINVASLSRTFNLLAYDLA